MDDYISREAALKAICDKQRDHTHWKSNYELGKYQGANGYVEAIKSVPAADVWPVRWISVKDRLPEDGKNCLLWYEYYHYSFEQVLPEYGIGYYVETYGIWCGDPSTGKDVKVLYWMPLPEPPKEVQDG